MMMNMNGEDGQKPGNWGIAITKEGKSLAAARYEEGAKERLEALKRKWGTQTPAIEYSIMIKTGELVYVGRYEEGVVLRVSGNEEHVTFLTTDMAAELGQALTTKL